MKRRRFLSITALICALSCVLALFGCSDQTNSTEDTSTQSATADPVTVRVGSLSGPTTIGMVSFMEKPMRMRQTIRMNLPFLVLLTRLFRL